MSDMYAIKASTLSALGDAMRNKGIVPEYRDEEHDYDIFKSRNISSYENATPSGISPEDIEEDFILNYPEATNLRIDYTIGVYTTDAYTSGVAGEITIGTETSYATSKYRTQSINSPNLSGDYSITIPDNKCGFYINDYNNPNIEYGVVLKVYLLDAEGNEIKIIKPTKLNTMTPLEMVDKIYELNTNPAIILPKIISRVNLPYFSITKEDFGDITKIGTYALSSIKGLNSIELPDTLQEIGDQGCNTTSITEITLPASLNKLGSTCFGNNSLLTTVRILNDTSVITCPTASIYSDPFYNCPKLTSIYIPSKLYNDYRFDTYWGQHEAKFIAVGEWAFDPMINSVLSFNQTKEVSIQLQNFANTPEFSITSSNEEVATISNVSINEDNTLLTYTINSLAVEGSSIITVNIIGENNTFNFINNARVLETIPEPTYEVVAVDGATYGFALREDGYWESQNFKQANSGAVCQVNISNPLNTPVYFDCINYAEANYDYGSLGAVNQVLSKNSNDDSGVKRNFKGLSKADIQTVEYTDASGDCFIQVKFRKDSSGDQNNDSIRFKVRFGG